MALIEIDGLPTNSMVDLSSSLYLFLIPSNPPVPTEASYRSHMGHGKIPPGPIEKDQDSLADRLLYLWGTVVTPIKPASIILIT
jgi:hypothetical protein